MSATRLLPLLASLAASCASGSNSAHDHGELFWAGKVNVDPFHLPCADSSPGLRTAFELERSGIRGVPRGNHMVHDYDVVFDTVTLAPEIRIQDWLSVTPQVGFGRHDVKATLEGTTSGIPIPYLRADDGSGGFAAIGCTLKPLPWLHVFGRLGRYRASSFDQDFSEAGIKLGLHDPVWIFAAWRTADLSFAAPGQVGNSFFRRGGDVEANGLLLGAELRF